MGDDFAEDRLHKLLPVLPGEMRRNKSLRPGIVIRVDDVDGVLSQYALTRVDPTDNRLQRLQQREGVDTRFLFCPPPKRDARQDLPGLLESGFSAVVNVNSRVFKPLIGLRI